MKSPGVSRLRQPAASALGWVVAGVLAIMLGKKGAGEVAYEMDWLAASSRSPNRCPCLQCFLDPPP